jgi:hypothetical protein
VSSQKTPEISPLFKVNPNVVINVGWVRDGKLNVGFSGWDANKVVLDDQVFELSWGPQGVEGRIIERRGRRKRAA